MKYYGTPDPDNTVYLALMDYLSEQAFPEPEYILHFTRVPIDSRMCKLPRSLKCQAILPNKLVITAIQYEPEGRIFFTQT